MGIKGIRVKRRGGKKNKKGVLRNIYCKRQSNKADISKHVNIQKQVIIQT
jgi:hypothetical protein